MSSDSFHNFRTPKPRHVQRQAIDVIIGAPTGPRQIHDNVPLQRRPSPKHPEVRRRLDDFNRSEGYHPVAQQVMRPQVSREEHTQLSPSTDQPLLVNKTILRHGQSAARLVESKRAKRTKQKHGWKRVRKWTFRLALVTGLVIFITAGMLFTKGYLKLHQVFKGTTTAAALQADVNPSLLKGEGDGRINILLLGIGGQGHDGPDLTDTMLLASVDPVNDKATLLSIPRDFWVKMPNNFIASSAKINAAYESGKYKYLGKLNASNSNQAAINAGFKAVDQTVSSVIGAPIHYNVLVDFQAFKQAVDTVGGVTINVPEQLYDPTIAWENHWNPVIAKPGIQTMNGDQALLYARSRETSSDFARSERQRSLLVGLKDKTLSIGSLSNPLKLSSLMSAFGDNVRTDISLSDAQALYELMKKIPSPSITSIGLTGPPTSYITIDNMNGQSVVRPLAGYNNFTAIQNFVRKNLLDGYIIKENAPINVLNGTAVPSLATLESTTLKSYGYNISTVGDAPTQAYQQTVLVDLSGGTDNYTKHYLEQRFGVTAVTKLPDSTIQPGIAKFVIIIGQDASSKVINNQT